MRMSCIRLRANSRLAILFEDFLEICDGDMLAALLLAILVYWTDIKLAKKDTNLWIWKSHEDFQEDLMVDKPGMQPPHRTTISKKLDFLAAKDFIEWRKNPKRALDRTRHYLVHLPEVQAAIDRLPPIVSRKTDIRLLENRHSEEQASEAPSEDNANVEKPTYAESRKTDNALSEKQHCNVEKPTSNTNDYITEITPSEITEEGTYGANAPTPADLSSEELHEKVDGAIIGVETVKRITDKHKAVQPNETPYHIASKGAIGNERVDTPGRLTLPSRDKIGASTHDASSNALPDLPDNSAGNRYNDNPAAPAMAGQGQVALSVDPQHTPGPGALPSAADPFFGRSNGNTSDQAISVSPSLDSEPAQADFPPAGSAASGTTTAQASGRRSTVPRRPKGKPAVLELTLAGMDVKSWYEQVRGKLRMTERNVNDCNALGECDGIELESLRVYFEHVEALKWVKQYGVVIDLATAAGTTGNDKLQFLSFESNWPLVKKKLQLEQRKNSDDDVADDDYSPAGILKLHEQRARKQAQERGV